MRMTCYYSYRTPSQVSLNYRLYLQSLEEYLAIKLTFRKVNLCLSLLLTDHILGQSLLNLVQKKKKKLGIWVTRNHKDLYKANYHPLLSNLKQDLEC